MDKKKFFIVGGSSGIGLELVKVLSDNHHEIYVGSRTADKLAQIPGVYHIPMDFDNLVVKVDGADEVVGACARAVAEILD